jgi:hypothetical protein
MLNGMDTDWMMRVPLRVAGVRLRDVPNDRDVVVGLTKWSRVPFSKDAHGC